MPNTQTTSSASAPAQSDEVELPPRSHLIISFIFVTLILAIAAAAAVFYSTGGRWFVVTTPSMGEAAPVGTLVLTTPATSPVTAGEVISFNPPATHETFTHRVTSVDGDGTIHTRGDINGAVDPWQLHMSNVVGRVAVILPNVGWIVRAVPYVTVGILGLWLLTGLAKTAASRASMRISGISIVASVTAFILKPFVGIVMLATFIEHGQAKATIVSTGIMPIRVTATGGTHADLVAGSVATVSAPAGHTSGYSVTTALHLNVGQWVVLGLICAAPLIWCLTVGLPPREGVEAEGAVV